MSQFNFFYLTQILQRDGYQCLVTGWYEIKQVSKNFKAAKAELEAAHILKRAVAIFNDRQVGFLPHCHLIINQAACCQRTSAFATWDIIRQYADWPDETLEDMMQLIDTPSNGFMLQHDYHNAFENFYWTLVPEVCWTSISVNRHAGI